MTIKTIESNVRQLLAAFGDDTLPIRVEDIAKKIGLKVIPYPLEDGISGILVIEDGTGTIGYNHHESPVRRRFTVAHELGHFQLHREHSSLFLDKKFKVLFRSQTAPENRANQQLEQEANAFAAALLMPEHLLRREIELIEFDLTTEDALKKLAGIFNVSSVAMSYRMARLGII